MAKKHIKTTKEKGGIVSIENFIDLSNLKLVVEKKKQKSWGEEIMTPRLKELYFKEIQPDLKIKLGLKNIYRTENKSYFKYGFRTRWKWL